MNKIKIAIRDGEERILTEATIVPLFLFTVVFGF